MSRACKICNHPDRKEIDEMLVMGVSYGTIAKRFGCSKPSIQRHKTNHLIPKIPPEAVALAVLDPVNIPVNTIPKVNGFDLENMFEKIQVMLEKNFELVDKYELLDVDGNFIGTPADVKAKAAAISAMKGTLEYVSKLFGLVSPDGVSPGYLQLKDKYEKQKQFILEHLCDDCRVDFVKFLEE